MKVAILIPRLKGGGAEHVAKGWAAALVSLGHDVTLLLTHDRGEDDAFKTHILSPAGSAPGFIRLIKRLGKHLSLARYGAVISLMPYCNLLALMAAHSVRPAFRPSVIISEHTIHAELNKNDRLSHRIQWSMARALYRHADACVAVSHAVATELAAACGVLSSRIWVVPNPAAEGIEIQSGRKPPVTRGVGRRRSLAIVVPSRLIPQKRLNIALESALLVRERLGIAVRVEFFGTGPDEEPLKNLGEELGIQCVFRGWVDRWYEHIPEDGVVLLPSGSEGFGNVLIEAAAMSVPAVVSSKALGVADACIPNITAKLVGGDGSADYAEGIMEASLMVLPDVRQWLGRFTNDSAAMHLERILRTRTSGVDAGEYQLKASR